MRTTFFLVGEHDQASLRRLDPDESWRIFRCGQRNWVLQTYLRLARAGLPVELSAELPQEGLVVFHARQRHAVISRGRPDARVVLVGVRGDCRDPLIADFEIVQNGRYADDRQRFFVPHWPQPGLQPRAADRGARIRRIDYKGWIENLDRSFLKSDWEHFLAARGIEWHIDGPGFEQAADRQVEIEWADYREVDLVLSVRRLSWRHRFCKPATKLYNAWLAGVPAILGREYAVREIRRSELDYLEVSSVADAKRAVSRLIEDPELYLAMVRHGRERATQYSIDATLGKWTKLLTETLPELVGSDQLDRSRRLSFERQRMLRRIGAFVSLRPVR